jgi:hypothetical protein
VKTEEGSSNEFVADQRSIVTTVLHPSVDERQLRDMKGSAVIETMTPDALAFYAGLCGETLARAHARSGDPIALAAYLGKKDRFDQSIADFSERYADQNERDDQAFTTAIRSGRLEALEGV